MKPAHVLPFFAVLVILSSTWSRAAASTSLLEIQPLSKAAATLTITNPLPKAVLVTLSGVTDYTVNLSPNQTISKQLIPGVYHYKYYGCNNKKYSGVLSYQDGIYNLEISPCKMITLRIINPFFEDYKSSLRGWVNYEINVPAGQIKSFELVAGPYQLSYTCGQDAWNGKIKLNKNITWLMCTS